MSAGDGDIFSAAFGGSSSSITAAAAAKTRADSRASDDPLSQLWLPAPAVVPGPVGGIDGGGLADGGATPLPAEQTPLFDDDERVSRC